MGSNDVVPSDAVFPSLFAQGEADIGTVLVYIAWQRSKANLYLDVALR